MTTTSGASLLEWSVSARISLAALWIQNSHKLLQFDVIHPIYFFIFLIKHLYYLLFSFFRWTGKTFLTPSCQSNPYQYKSND